MRKQRVMAFVWAGALAACSPSYTYDGAWVYSLEKSIQANKRAIENRGRHILYSHVHGERRRISA
jgi:hypothetical protein